MKKINIWGLLLLTLILSGCDLLSKFQLFPSEITTMEASFDLAAIFGVYSINSYDNPFKVKYIERKNSNLLLISCSWADENHPNLIILDADDLSLLQEKESYHAIGGTSPSLIFTGEEDNDIIGNFYLNADLESYGDIDNLTGYGMENYRYIYSASSNEVYGLHPMDQETAGGTTESAIFYDLNGYMMYPSRTMLPDGLLSINTATGRKEFSYLTSAAPFPDMNIFIVGTITDISTQSAFLYGFVPYMENSDYLYLNESLQIEAAISIYEIDLESLTASPGITLPKRSSYCRLMFDTQYGNYHEADIHYTRIGWALKNMDDSGAPLYELVSAGGSGTGSSSTISVENSAAETFSYDGKHIYYIDQRNLRLNKSKTPW